MDSKTFEAILPLKIQDLISLINKNKNLNFNEALHYLYNSKLYEKLSEEESKLWHLSTAKLFLMLEDEKNTKMLTYPDFV
jgi:hypothetical protein